MSTHAIDKQNQLKAPSTGQEVSVPNREEGWSWLERIGLIVAVILPPIGLVLLIFSLCKNPPILPGLAPMSPSSAQIQGPDLDEAYERRKIMIQLDQALTCYLNEARGAKQVKGNKSPGQKLHEQVIDILKRAGQAEPELGIQHLRFQECMEAQVFYELHGIDMQAKKEELLKLYGYEEDEIPGVLTAYDQSRGAYKSLSADLEEMNYSLTQEIEIVPADLTSFPIPQVFLEKPIERISKEQISIQKPALAKLPARLDFAIRKMLHEFALLEALEGDSEEACKKIRQMYALRVKNSFNAAGITNPKKRDAILYRRWDHNLYLDLEEAGEDHDEITAILEVYGCKEEDHDKILARSYQIREQRRSAQKPT